MSLFACIFYHIVSFIRDTLVLARTLFRFHRSTALAASALLASVALAPATVFADRGAEEWVTTWAASPQSALEGLFEPAPEPMSFDEQTVRMIARVSLGGKMIRVRLDNRFGTVPLLVGEAGVALHAGGGNIVPGSARTLTFGGQTGIVVPVGAPALSDPVNLDVENLAELAISLYLPGPTPAASVHALGHQTSYLTPPDWGSYIAAEAFPTMLTSESRYFLSGIEVRPTTEAKTIVTLGDSITDGFGSSTDANARWPDVLAERLLAPTTSSNGGTSLPEKRSVANAGISGNRILNTVIGPNALSRFDRDVLAQPGVAFVTLLEGINDIGLSEFLPEQEVSANQIIQGYRQLIVRAHAHCVKVVGATLTPFEGSLYFTPEGEDKRQALNAFIRDSGEFDAIIDFDAAVRDPAQPKRLLSAYDVGDNLHPSDDGYRAMAEAIDLSVFEGTLEGCR